MDLAAAVAIAPSGHLAVPGDSVHRRGGAVVSAFCLGAGVCAVVGAARTAGGVPQCSGVDSTVGARVAMGCALCPAGNPGCSSGLAVAAIAAVCPGLARSQSSAALYATRCAVANCAHGAGV